MATVGRTPLPRGLAVEVVGGHGAGGGGRGGRRQGGGGWTEGVWGRGGESGDGGPAAATSTVVEVCGGVVHVACGDAAGGGEGVEYPWAVASTVLDGANDPCEGCGGDGGED